jgi:hypothetical protein
MGVFSTSGRFGKVKMAAAVTEHFETLNRVVAGSYPPARERHDRFFTGSRSERHQLTKQVFFGQITQSEIETVTDQLTEWVNGKTVRFLLV